MNKSFWLRYNVALTFACHALLTAPFDLFDVTAHLFCLSKFTKLETITEKLILICVASLDLPCGDSPPQGVITKLSRKVHSGDY